MKKFVLFTAALAAFVVAGIADASAQKRRSARPASQSVRVEITKLGYEPASITLKRGVPARITFLRTTDSTCAKEVVFADFGVNRPLPLNEEVLITFTPSRSGEFAFTCGMNMHRGKLLVR